MHKNPRQMQIKAVRNALQISQEVILKFAGEDITELENADPLVL